MSQNFLFNASFHLFLNEIDQELANNIQQQGCPYCKSKLHRADYPRSPCGTPSEFRDFYDSRLAFCCSNCRKRTTPISVRFFGRRWYPAPFFILISVLRLGINKRRLLQIKKHFGLVVSETTWRRWRRWWNATFVKTRFWAAARGQLPSVRSITSGIYPRALLDMFQGDLKEKVVLLLRYVAPLTVGNSHEI